MQRIKCNELIEEYTKNMSRKGYLPESQINSTIKSYEEKIKEMTKSEKEQFLNTMMSVVAKIKKLKPYKTCGCISHYGNLKDKRTCKCNLHGYFSHRNRVYTNKIIKDHTKHLSNKEEEIIAKVHKYALTKMNLLFYLNKPIPKENIEEYEKIVFPLLHLCTFKTPTF
jgi:hypothetical protein